VRFSTGQRLTARRLESFGFGDEALSISLLRSIIRDHYEWLVDDANFSEASNRSSREVLTERLL